MCYHIHINYYTILHTRIKYVNIYYIGMSWNSSSKILYKLAMWI